MSRRSGMAGERLAIRMPANEQVGRAGTRVDEYVGDRMARVDEHVGERMGELAYELAGRQ